jgi:hypothetical protein
MVPMISHYDYDANQEQIQQKNYKYELKKKSLKHRIRGI